MYQGPSLQKHRYRLEFTGLRPDAPLVDEVAPLLEEANASGEDFIVCTSNPELARHIYDTLSGYCESSRLRLDGHCSNNCTEVGACACVGNCRGGLEATG